METAVSTILVAGGIIEIEYNAIQYRKVELIYDHE